MLMMMAVRPRKRRDRQESLKRIADNSLTRIGLSTSHAGRFLSIDKFIGSAVSSAIQNTSKSRRVMPALSQDGGHRRHAARCKTPIMKECRDLMPISLLSTPITKCPDTMPAARKAFLLQFDYYHFLASDSRLHIILHLQCRNKK